MRKIGQTILTIGVLMLAAGFTFPFFLGSAIPPMGYNVLQIGGIALALVGLVVRAFGKKKDRQAGA
jgi:hypothetical protein